MGNGTWTYTLKCSCCGERKIVEALSMKYDWQTFYSLISNLVKKSYTFDTCRICTNKYTKQDLISFDSQTKN